MFPNSPLLTESTEELTPLGIKTQAKGFKFSDQGGPTHDTFSPEELKRAYHAAHNVNMNKDSEIKTHYLFANKSSLFEPLR